MKNYAVRITLHNSSCHTKAEVDNCFDIHSKYFQSSKNTKCIMVNGFSLRRRIFAKQWPIPPLLLDFGCFDLSEDKL